MQISANTPEELQPLLCGSILKMPSTSVQAHPAILFHPAWGVEQGIPP